MTIWNWLILIGIVWLIVACILGPIVGKIIRRWGAMEEAVQAREINMQWRYNYPNGDVPRLR